MDDKNILKEVKNLIIMIEKYKEEASELGVKKEGFDVVKNHLNLVIEESKSSVEKLINNINNALNNLEKILELNKKLKDTADKEIIQKQEEIIVNTMNILTESITLMEFQDIISQRVNKVLEFLQDIEKRILKILLLLGISDEEFKDKRKEFKKKLEELEWEKEVKQDDVDDILKEFGL